MSFIVSKPSPYLICLQSHRKLARQHVTTTCCTKHADDKQPRRPSRYQQASSWFSCKGLVAAGAALSLAVSSAVAAEDLTITFQASRDPEIRKVQKSMVEAWGACAPQHAFQITFSVFSDYTCRIKAQSDQTGSLQLRLCGNTIYGTSV